MQIGDEVIWSAISAIVVGITLKSSEYFISKKSKQEDNTQEKIQHYQESIEDEVIALREENRNLRAEVDKYRQLYYDLLERREGTVHPHNT